MKRAVIVHCWGGHPDQAWYPWARVALEKLGYHALVPAMPHTDEPRLDEWLPALQQLVGVPDEELVLVGHSIGSVTVMRYLETLPAGQQVGKVILVTSYTDPIGFEELENFFPKPLDFSAIKTKSLGGFTVIQSDNDPFVAAQYGERLQAELHATLIIKRNAGHIDEDAGITELPELIADLNG